ncbi:MAG: hypothetical protein JXA69_15940 [Phycisphaerae bacterium]|nr:hypothetical protein [Phycisphaerae bacterium]
MSARPMWPGWGSGLVVLCVAVAGGAFVAVGQEPIIIDHTCTRIHLVPAYWIEQAKQLTIHYAHTSHGGQINTGAEVFEGIDPWYSFARRQSPTEGLPPIEDPPALRMYDGNPPETYIEPNDYWDGEPGKNRTRAVAATGNYMFSMWSWCGQQSSNSEATTQRYLDTMAQFEIEFPSMRFIYMTGHTDGTGETGNLNLRNEQVRNYCIANNKVLFDFADIESYDPDGNYYLDRGCNDYCNYVGGNWANEWCAAHPGDDLCVSCSCAHSKALNCNLKARAFWWMMARLAGWPGPPRSDLDGDADVDLDDFTIFQPCFNGPNRTYPPDCNAADLDDDGDVDLSDFSEFATCFNGPNRAARCW